MAESLLLDTLRWEFEMTWNLAERHHLPLLTDDICLWVPGPATVTVRHRADGAWRADWIDDAGEPGPTASIAWLTWHIQWWLGDALAEAKGEPSTPRENVIWPGSADGVRTELGRIVEEWRAVLNAAAGCDLDRLTGGTWPGPSWPMHRLLAWVNMELMKNVAEIGQVLREAFARGLS